jgi:hypothetical protein
VVGRVLARLGIEHIPSYSLQARGRVERLNRTLQDRLVNELRLAGITTLAAANGYLVTHFLPDYHAQFTRPPADPASAFVPLGDTVDLEQLLAEDVDRIVGDDNTVVLDHLVLQLAKQPGRRSCARLPVTVRRHLNGVHSVWRGLQCLGHYDAQGQPLLGPPPRPLRPRRPRQGPAPASRPQTHARTWPYQRVRRGDPYLTIPPNPPRPAAAAGLGCPSDLERKRTDYVSKPTGHFTCQQQAAAA